MRKIYILISVLVVVGVAVVVWPGANSKSVQLVACTIEAKLCPNGSAVGRTGPNCEFAECPSSVLYDNASPDLIQVEAPLVNAVVGKEFSVIGKARGAWFFEASFPIVVLGKEGEVLIETHATAQSDWMTEDFVPFRADIKIPESYTGPAKLILKKDNPSGLAEHDASISFDIAVEADLPAQAGAKKDLKSTGTIKGLVTLSPICPVERMPPEPQCAPKPYQTKIEAFSADGSKLIGSTQTGSDGSFTIALPFGNYTIQAGGGTIHPSCSPVAVHLQTATTSVDISCDTGIR